MRSLHATVRRGHAYRQAGFTLVELLVVVAIMTIVTAIILANNSRFGGEVVLQDTAYDLALSVRQAQVYGISVSGVHGAFNVGYGMHFSSAVNNSYLLFADSVNPNGIYDSGEALQTSTIATGVTIKGLYVPACTTLTYNGTSFTCTGGTSVTTLDVVFVRPEPNAWLNASCARPAGSNEACTGGGASAEIAVVDPKGDFKSIIINQSGEITVQ